MFNLLVILAILATVVFTASTNGSEVEAEMVAAGMKPAAAEGVIAIAKKYDSELKEASGDSAASKKLFETIKSESDAFIKTQSTADQAAYAAFVQKKKEEFEAQNAGSAPTMTH